MIQISSSKTWSPNLGGHDSTSPSEQRATQNCEAVVRELWVGDIWTRATSQGFLVFLFRTMLISLKILGWAVIILRLTNNQIPYRCKRLSPLRLRWGWETFCCLPSSIGTTARVITDFTAIRAQSPSCVSCTKGLPGLRLTPTSSGTLLMGVSHSKGLEGSFHDG